ncbi:MAG: alpha/beta hydrolase [Nibricoccus sp.]
MPKISFGALRRLFVVFSLLTSPCSYAQQEIPVWKDGAPGLKHERAEASEDRHETGRMDRYISYVSNPTLTIYPADPAKATGAAVLVVPGGGFRYVCLDKEGIEPAQWLNSIGVTAVVLKYRTLDPEKERSAKTIEPLFAETERAMRVVRAHAAEWKIDPKKIGIMGFSAGAIMAVRLVVDADAGDAAAADPVEKAGSRPDFVVFVYGAVPPGKQPKIDKTAPPFFLVHAADDPKAPVSGALKVFQFLNEGGASAELHVYHRGDHGFGMTPKLGTVRDWTSSCASWMRDLGIIPAQ